MIHDKIYERHEFIHKLRITSIHNEIHTQTHEQKFINKITMTSIHFIQNQICAQINK